MTAIDCRRNTNVRDNKDKTIIELENGTKAWYEVVIYGGRTPTGLDTLQWAQKVENLGSGEILLTSMPYRRMGQRTDMTSRSQGCFQKHLTSPL